jgi:hypothetical protein
MYYVGRSENAGTIKYIGIIYLIIQDRIKGSKPFFILLPGVPQTADISVSYKWDPRVSILESLKMPFWGF